MAPPKLQWTGECVRKTAWTDESWTALFTAGGQDNWPSVTESLALCHTKHWPVVTESLALCHTKIGPSSQKNWLFVT